MIARMGESGRYDYEGGGSVLARWQGIAASCALGLVLLAPAVISTPVLAASGTLAPAADPHPVPTGLAPIPTVEDPVDAAEEDHPTDGKPPGKLVRYQLVATTDATGLRLDNISVSVKCQDGESFAISVAVGAIGGKLKPAFKITGRVEGGVGAALKPVELQFKTDGYLLGASNAYCIGTDGSQGAGIREPHAKECKPKKGRITRCGFQAVFK